jgi:hypothetical protein
MKYLLSIFFLSACFTLSAQHIPTETFEEHMKILSQSPEILKKYKVVDDAGDPVFYINLGQYEQYAQSEPIPYQNTEIYLWSEGGIFFFDAKYSLELLWIEENEDESVLYKFVYPVDKKKFFIEARFIQQKAGWNLQKPAITKVKSAK